MEMTTTNLTTKSKMQKAWHPFRLFNHKGVLCVMSGAACPLPLLTHGQHHTKKINEMTAMTTITPDTKISNQQCEKRWKEKEVTVVFML